MRWGSSGIAAAAALIGCATPDPPARAPAGLLINEVAARNDGAWADPDGVGECPETDDWVELYNAGDRPVPLAGHTLSDDPDPATALVLPDRTLAPGERLLVVADDQPEQGELHAPFKVSADGESLWLRDPTGREIDRVDVPALRADVVWARWGDGAATFRFQEPTPGAPNEAPPDDPCFEPRGGFDDHTVPCVATVAGFEALADGRGRLSVVKLDVLDFQRPADRRVVFLDNRFYQLHDEWYLFRMLNGQPVPGETLFSAFPGNFASIDEIYAWAAGRDLAALFPTSMIRWAEDRLTSSRYYELALGDPRVIGAGTLVRVPPVGGDGERWAFELEYTDLVEYDELVAYFETLTPALAPEIGADLRWLVRSPQQEDLAAQMIASDLPYADRVLSYDEISEPGQVEVYRPGTVAGRVRVVRGGVGLEDATAEDVLVLDAVPDWLPPCAALITSVPQTPLSHVALLAESRGIPNLHLAGAVDDPQWDSWGRTRVRVALRATAPDGLEAVQLTVDEYATWLASQESTPPVLEAPDPDTLPWAVDLRTVPPESMPDQRPALGGKSSGFLALLGAAVETPYAPLAVSVRAYHAQRARIDGLDEVLAAPEFGQPGDARARYLVLEGRDAYDLRHPTAADAAFADTFVGLASPRLAAFASGGGVRGAWRDTPIDPAVLAPIEAALDAQFAALDPAQGLRFRSSSNVEDVEGFNGAGLYESASGEPADALREVWASYWGAESFEERHAAGLDHTAGGMGVLVHPAFDDELELANGVLTVTVLPDGDPDRYRMTVNAQPGDLSVTNPPTDTCVPQEPEIVQVAAPDGGPPTIERLRRADVSPDADVLSDAELLALFDQATAVAALWLDVENAASPPEHARSTLTLDQEFRKMDPAWPAFADGHPSGERLVLKQSRSLEPSVGHLPPDVQDEPFPRDLLARADAVTGWSCRTASLDASWVEATTDPLATPDLGHAETPFVARLTLDARAAVPALGLPAGATRETTWLDDDTAGVVGGSLVLDGPGGTFSEPLDGPCTETIRWADPVSWLDGLLDGP